MRTLHAWSTEPGSYLGEIQEFTAGAMPVQDSRVLALPRANSAPVALGLIAAVPPQSSELATLTAGHEDDAITGVDYFARWAILLPTTTKPYALARLDLRLGGPTVFEARLLFDIARYATSLWAAAHTGWVRLVSPGRLTTQKLTMRTAAAMPPALVLSTYACPLADALTEIGLVDPFAQRAC